MPIAIAGTIRTCRKENIFVELDCLASGKYRMNAKENILCAIRHQVPPWIPDGMGSAVFIAPPIITRPQTAGRDSWNVKWDCDAGGTFPAAHDYVITDLHKWREQVNFPDLDSCDWSRFTSGWGGQGQPLALHDINREEYLLCGVIELSLFERSCLLMGMEEALMAYVAEPDLMAELLEAIADFNIDMIQRFDDFCDIAFRETKPGSVCLLSPAAASYDEFNNFEERGNRFRELVKRSKGNS